jgi:hypothetical protein
MTCLVLSYFHEGEFKYIILIMVNPGMVDIMMGM